MKKLWFNLSIIIFLTLIVYVNSFQNDFVYDDSEVIVENIFIRNWKNFAKIFSKDYFRLAVEIAYRPICTLTFFIDYSLWKLNVFGWHLTNIALHLANAILIYFLVSLIFSQSSPPITHYPSPNHPVTQSPGHPVIQLPIPHSPSPIPLFTALLFALHPVLTEVVDGISFREDLLSFFFFLLAFYLYLRSTQSPTCPPTTQWWSHPITHYPSPLFYTASCLCFVLALFSKEMAITLPLVLILYDFCFHRFTFKTKHFWKRYLIYFLLASVYLFGKFTVFKPLNLVLQGVISPLKYEYPGGNFYTMVLTMSKAVLYYIKLLFFPTKLSVHYVFPIAQSLFEPSVIISIGFLFIIFFVAIKLLKSFPAISFTIFYFFLTLLPVSNIIPFGPVIQERYLYFSTFGFCLFSALICAKTLNSLPRRQAGAKAQKKIRRFGGYFCIFSVLALYSLRTINRNRDWENNLTLWSKVLRIYPNSGQALFVLANEYSLRGEKGKAIAFYQKSLEKIHPLSFGAALIYNNLGILYQEEGEHDTAIKHFEKALAIVPQSSAMHNNLGMVYALSKRYEEAVKSFRKAIEIDASFIDAYLNLARVYLLKERYGEAAITLKKAAEIDPNNPKLRAIHQHIFSKEIQ